MLTPDLRTMTRSIHSFIDPCLLERALRHDHIARRLLAALPAPLRGHCWLAPAHGTELRLLTDNPHLVPMLRYRQSELLQLANADPDSEPKLAFNRLRISIYTPPSSPPRDMNRVRARNLPRSASVALTAVARRTDSLQLRQALMRLAAHQTANSPREGG